MKRFSQVRVLAADVRTYRRKLGPDKRGRESEQSAGQPCGQDDRFCRNQFGDDRRVHEDPGADDAAHDDHGGIEESETSRELWFRHPCCKNTDYISMGHLVVF
jgi:hypothetical protein